MLHPSYKQHFSLRSLRLCEKKTYQTFNMGQVSLLYENQQQL